MKMNIRKATLEDIPKMQEIFAFARNFMAKTGNPNQWVNGYPSDDLLRSDIENGDTYVCFEGEELVACFVLRGGDDPTYAIIEDGKWLNNEPYATIHRIASSGKAHGVLHAAVEFAQKNYRNIRIDTHKDNKVMQKAILKEGFTYCGIIYCWSGDERLAYQKCCVETR